MSQPELFRCEIRDAGTGVIALAPAGELDAATVDEVADALRDAQSHALAVLILDLRGLTFMDSTGLHLILETDAWARQAGVQVMVVPGRGVVRRLFEITGADRALQLVDRPPDHDAGSGRGARHHDLAASPPNDAR